MASRRGQHYERLLAQEKLILAVTEYLIEVLKERGESRKDLADRLGKSKAFVSQALNGSRNMTLRTLADFCWAVEREPKFILHDHARPEQRPLEVADKRRAFQIITGWDGAACEPQLASLIPHYPLAANAGVGDEQYEGAA